MEKLSKLDALRLANASPKFAAMIKIAQNFDENVPGAQAPNDPNAQNAGAYTSNQASPQNQQAQAMPPQVVPPEEEYAAVPEEEMMQQEQGLDSPEDVGARAAQAFLMPFYDAAMNGDPAAQSIIAQAAGNIAGSVSESYAKSMMAMNQTQMQGGPQDMMQQPPQTQQAPPAIPTPEEEVANEIVADQPAASPTKPNDENEQGDKEGEEKKKKKPPFPFKK